MSTTETIAPEQAGEQEGICRNCQGLLALDQRYCLNCGLRSAEARVPFMDILRDQGRALAESTTAVAAASPRERNPWLLAAATGGFGALILAIGVAIGDEGPQKPPVISQKAPVVNVSVPAGGGGAPVEQVDLAEDWPAGKAGFTVQLSTLPKEGTQQPAVDAAKSDAEGKGADKVGLIDADLHEGLDGGQYIIYSGVYKKKAQAAKALKKLKKKFPDAEVIKVVKASGGASGGDSSKELFSGKKKNEGTASKAALEDLKNSSPKDYQKKSAKLPDKTKLPGKAPPKDNKKPGGGSGGGETIE